MKTSGMLRKKKFVEMKINSHVKIINATEKLERFVKILVIFLLKCNLEYFQPYKNLVCLQNAV